MRILFRILVVGTLVSLGCAGTTPEKPLSISISLEKPTLKSGSEVVITIHLTNNMNRELNDSANVSDLTGLNPNYLFDVRDGAGKPAPKRRYEHPELATGRAVFRTIRAGESITDVQNIGRLFDMSRPGSYSIQVSRMVSCDGKEVEGKSNKLFLTVTQ